MSRLAMALRAAARDLPAKLRIWMAPALGSDLFQIGFGRYEDDGGNGVCPVVAAAKLAGAWEAGAFKPGWERCGGPDGPSTEVEDFAAYFDLCSELFGVGVAVEVVLDALGVSDASAAVAPDSAGAARPRRPAGRSRGCSGRWRRSSEAAAT